MRDGVRRPVRRGVTHIAVVSQSDVLQRSQICSRSKYVQMYMHDR